MLRPTVEQVQALAPDAASVSAARSNASPAKWQGLGRGEGALFGECQGSAVYKVLIDGATLAGTCTCPSRKHPCKHVLALLLLFAERGEAVLPEGAPPAWAAERLEKRKAADEKKAERREKLEKAAAEGAPAAVVDEKAQRARAEKREGRIDDGAALLSRWLEDLVRGGLTELSGAGPAPFHAMAARLVDAQAPGLAGRVRRMAEIPGAGAHWPERLLRELGRTALLVRAWERRQALPAPLLAEVRREVGLSPREEEVIASGERVADRFAVVGRRVEAEDRIFVERLWLRGASSGRSALLLRFSPGPRMAFGEPFPAGTIHPLSVAYHPGAGPQRVAIQRRDGPMEPLGGIPHPRPIAGALDEAAHVFARAPWAERTCLALAQVRVARAEGRFLLADGAGDALPLAPDVEPWRLLAVTNAKPADVGGEWDGEAFLPLGVVAQGRFQDLAPSAESGGAS